jgi:hypothetical protein
VLKGPAKWLRATLAFACSAVNCDSRQLAAFCFLSQQGDWIMRYVGYVRISMEEHAKGYSLDAQRRIIEEWIQSKGGQ